MTEHTDDTAESDGHTLLECAETLKDVADRTDSDVVAGSLFVHVWLLLSLADAYDDVDREDMPNAFYDVKDQWGESDD